MSHSRDEQGDTAGRQRVEMSGVRSATKEDDEDIDRENNEGSPYQTFAHGIEAVG